METTQPEIQAVTPAPAPAPKKSSFGILIGILVILAAIVLGALYFWDQRSDVSDTTADVSTLEEQGTSTDPADIQADLSAQSPDTFDADLDNAFGELDASLQ